MTLSRRTFLGGAAGTGAALSLAACGIHSGSTTAATPTPGAKTTSPVAGDGVLVLLTLYGGNDGLDTVVPAESGTYQSARGDLARSPHEVLALGDGLGLHPALKQLKSQWDDGHLAVVRGVGIDDEDRSHFHCMDYWQSAGELDGAGWLGRWLDSQKHDPMRALAIGDSLPLLLQGKQGSGSLVSPRGTQLPRDPRLLELFAQLSEPSESAPMLEAAAATAGTDLLTVAKVVGKATSAANGPAAKPPGARGSMPSPKAGGDASAADGYEGSGLHLVSQLIKAKAPTRVYAVSVGGFDTHAAERPTRDRLLTGLDAQVGGFLREVADKPVTLMAYSEFGRRVGRNGSGGTDHGTAGPVLVAGRNVKGGFVGDDPSLTDLADGDLRPTTGFRSVYATMLAQILGADPAAALGPAGARAAHLPLFL
jgi:uncharacterized protein (DUF1501 family)